MAIQLPTDELATTIDAVRANLGLPDADTIATFASDSSLADEPPSIGGADTGPTPVELVLAGLGTCQEIVYATYARILGIQLDRVSVRTEGRLDLRGFYGGAEVPIGFTDVTFDVNIDSPASEEEIAQLVAAVNAHCPVLEILRQPIPVAGTYSHNGQPPVVA